jgi:hypothetical protein
MEIIITYKPLWNPEDFYIHFLFRQLVGATSLTRSHESFGVAYLREADAERTRKH